MSGRKGRALALHLAGWAVLAALLFWAARQVPFAEVLQILSALTPQQIAGLVVFNIFAALFFSSRWWLALRAQEVPVPYLRVLRYRLAAFAVNYFTPGSQFGGEPLQVYLLQSQHGIPASTALASVTLDKLFELISNFTFLAVGVTLMIFYYGALGNLSTVQVTVWVSILLLAPLVYLALLGWGKSPLSWCGRCIPAPWAQARLVKRVIRLIQTTECEMSTLIRTKPLTVITLTLASGWIWALSLAEYWLALRILGAPVDLGQAVFALTAARLAFLSPLPGGLGALEASQVLALQALGFSPALGMAISLWIRGRDSAMGALGFAWNLFLLRRQSSTVPGPAGNVFNRLPEQAGD